MIECQPLTTLINAGDQPATATVLTTSLAATELHSCFSYMTKQQPNRHWGFFGSSVTNNQPANVRDTVSIPGIGRSPGEGNGNPLQYSWLGNPMDRGGWWATLHEVTKELGMTHQLNNNNNKLTLNLFPCFKDILQRYVRYHKSHCQLCLKKNDATCVTMTRSYRLPFLLGIRV